MDSPLPVRPGEGGEAASFSFTLCGATARARAAVLAHLGEAQTAERAGEANGQPGSVTLMLDGRPMQALVPPDGAGQQRALAAALAGSRLALILSAPGAGLDSETRRLIHLAHLLGAPQIALLVDDMADAGWREAGFRAVTDAAGNLAATLAIEALPCIPVSSRQGENIHQPTDRAPWHDGPTLADFLVTRADGETGGDAPLRMSVLAPKEPGEDETGDGGRQLTARLLSGAIQPGEDVLHVASGRSARVTRIVAMAQATGSRHERDMNDPSPGPTLRLALDAPLGASHGDLIATPRSRPEWADQVAADLFWTGEAPLLPGRPYRARCAGQYVGATVTRLKHRLDVDHLASLAAKRLHRGEIGYVNVAFERSIGFDSGEDNPATGRFVLEDADSAAVVAWGAIRFALRRARNIPWQALDVDRSARAAVKGQHPCCLWFTGLSGSGKSTVANLLEKRLHALGRHTYVLDGDNVRHGLNRDLGFTDAERVENIRRVAEVARLMVDAGLIVMVSFISPFRAERRMARRLFEDGAFLEIFVDAPLEVCERRDPKGLYAKARAGQIANFTGLDSPYEPPEQAELRLDTARESAEAHVERILETLRRRGFI